MDACFGRADRAAVQPATKSQAQLQFAAGSLEETFPLSSAEGGSSDTCLGSRGSAKRLPTNICSERGQGSTGGCS